MLSRAILRSVNNCLLRQFQAPCLVKALCTSAPLGNGWQSNTTSSGSGDDFERIFGGLSGTDSTSDSFFRRLDRAENYRKLVSDDDDELSGSDESDDNEELSGSDESVDTLSDGMDEQLEEAASFFEVDHEEMFQEGYTFRPDMSIAGRDTYELRDLDLTKPAWSGRRPEEEFNITTKEALEQADFRNVRFLANFITEAGIIIKRSQTEISAKAQRRIAREIKTARAFGLMPFTTMGTKSFIFGRNMENQDKDFEYDGPGAPVEDNVNDEDNP